jgi:hypothetical protein
MADHVVVGTGGHGSRFLKRDWPLTDGLTAGTTTQEGHKETLEYEESFVEEKEKELL